MKTWILLINPFLSATRKSFLKAMRISTYHDSALNAAKSDPDIQVAYNYYHPIHLNYKTLYDDWIQQGGEQQGKTLNLNQLLRLLSGSKIEQWDVKIQNQYLPNTPAYKRLLPNNRQPFQTGGQVERMNAVKVLSQTIGTDEALATVKTDVDSFNAQLEAAVANQKGDISSTRTDSSNLEIARQSVGDGQYANLGRLITKYASTPEKIAPFFDLQTIRRIKQTVFNGTLKGGEIHTIVKRKFNSTDAITLTNLGVEPLKFYLASAKDMQPGAVFVTVNGGAKTIVASELGDVANRYLTVLNTDAVHDAEFIMELE